MTAPVSNLVRRVILDSASPRYGIGLILERSSAGVVNALRMKYSRAGVQLPA